MDDHQFRQILDWHHLSWSGYRKVRKGVKKRLSRHMRRLGCTTVEAYLDVLAHEVEQRKDAEQLLFVTIGRFFRDRRLWTDMEQHLLPEIMSRGGTPLRVWSAGCACGEEVYSLLMVWDRLASRTENAPELEIWGTDANPEVLERARAGVYSRSTLRELDRDYRDAYLEAHPHTGCFAVDDRLKDNIVWRLNDLLTDAPPSQGLQLVLLRNNLLTYYQGSQQERALERIVGGMTPGGFLVIGSHEKLPAGFKNLVPSGINPLVFRKPLN